MCVHSYHVGSVRTISLGYVVILSPFPSQPIIIQRYNMSNILIGTLLTAKIAAQESLSDITCGHSYVVVTFSGDGYPVIISDEGTEQVVSNPLLRMFSYDTNPYKYTNAELNPISLKEQNLVMAVLALHRGDALECNGLLMRKGRTICVDKQYSRSYTEVSIPWGFIANWVAIIIIDENGAIYGRGESDDDNLPLPINLQLDGAKLPQVIKRPEGTQC